MIDLRETVAAETEKWVRNYKRFRKGQLGVSLFLSLWDFSKQNTEVNAKWVCVSEQRKFRPNSEGSVFEERERQREREIERLRSGGWTLNF